MVDKAELKRLANALQAELNATQQALDDVAHAHNFLRTALRAIFDHCGRLPIESENVGPLLAIKAIAISALATTTDKPGAP